MKKLLAVVGVVGALVTLIYTQRAFLVERVMERGLEMRMGADRVDTLDDGLHLYPLRRRFEDAGIIPAGQKRLAAVLPQ